MKRVLCVVGVALLMGCGGESDEGAVPGDAGVRFATPDASGGDVQPDTSTAAADAIDPGDAGVPADVEEGDGAEPSDPGSEPDEGPAKDVLDPDSTEPDPCAGQGVGAPCDADADPCTVDECGADGVCKSTGNEDDCQDEQASQPCWTFTCSKKAGCIPTVFVPGASCNDGNPCTMNDVCVEAELKACVGTPVPTDDSNPCTDDACAGGAVTHTPVDGIPCVFQGKSGVCEEGVCVTEGCTPLDGGWTAWVFGTCSVPCGGGQQAGTRTCTSPPPSCGGKACEGPAETTQTCNLQPCDAPTQEIACPDGVPFPKGECLALPASTSFGKVVDTGVKADSYGVSLVRGPGNTVAALYHQEEWFERLDEAGNIIQPAVRLPTLNPSLEPAALGDMGWPAFYGPELAYDGTVFGVARGGKGNGRAYFYTVAGNGMLVDGPLTIVPPGGADTQEQGPALAFGGGAWYLAWGAAEKLWLARIIPGAKLDAAWGDGGLLEVASGGTFRHPELAIDDVASVAGLVWGEGGFGVAVVNLGAAHVIARTGSCSSGMGTNGDGHDITWSSVHGEFGVLLSGQGTGLCDEPALETNAGILRLHTGGGWVGAPMAVLCGHTIGAGHRGGIASRPDGRYVVSMTRYHEKPFCIDGYPNGSQGVASLDMVTIEPKSGTIVAHAAVNGIPDMYTQVDVVWSGTRTTSMTPRGLKGSGSGYAFE